ncbi:MAG: phosphomethylpyrimidine synthase ThiC [Cenarchaeum sp. SB0665_bin_23]|nr:phosphomethylpyrimidine synthase ThiC [Cenarchaeum sp. SB0667_bin_13]MXY37960.1 phosphomethylpyrimidine synthase ThiC [Cenarchaeum sp. SB0664_bin_35]MXY60965.1 phosphomethylpyrimidine synthase ThiC [Cenarchaeum sp. SB0665_bin_23]MXZ93290.1 phosphomethylpyrimidine synthase ThiC [Cenarchaeum sp. SB0666_bin_15]MYB47629.1 phosphomethylpyrimidine synthase ThiC [Cenarchaeum sp. SB0662_bin_33]MYC79436.1 phosphomethylpyrimidine synthase ThiC [Cenarchaeum sp. SB0661_bin_35]MYD58382.1 phosphomethylp
MMTQMSDARQNRITPQMRQVAKDEDVSEEWLARRIARGSIIIPSNNARPQTIHNVGIGKGLKTKVNVNIGTSTLHEDLSKEKEKARVAVKYHADTIMDLSDGGDVGAIRRALLVEAPITFGTVPIYEAYNTVITKHKNPMALTEDDFLNAFENNAKDGVDYTTIHCGITHDIAERIMDTKRHAGVVSKGGTITAAWMLHHKKENPYYTHYDYLMEVAAKYDVTFSLGDALRPGSILDSHDELQVQEMINVARLTRRAHENNIQVMVEGPGHVPLNEVAANVRLAKSLIGDVPYYVLGPLVTDIASGHDHIASAIGAAVSAAEGVDLLCYLTPSEHLALPNAEEVKEGLIAYRIAAHAGDLVKIRDKAIKWDRDMSAARRTLDWERQLALSIDPEKAALIHSRTGQHPGNNVPCTMCGGACVYIMLPSQRTYTSQKQE